MIIFNQQKSKDFKKYLEIQIIQQNFSSMIPNQTSNQQKDNKSAQQPSQSQSLQSIEQTQTFEKVKKITKPKSEKYNNSNSSQKKRKQQLQLLPPNPQLPQQVFAQHQIPSGMGQQLCLTQFYLHFYHNISAEKYAEMQKEDSIQEVVIQKNNKKKIYNLEKGLFLDVKTLHKHFQFNKNQDQTIPVMVSVKTLDQTNYMEVESNHQQVDQILIWFAQLITLNL
ncbi:von willebrand factor type A domain protein (macronuclear) [Tetrahymena thermophila SB210]|uniref:von willebrand factor type A domain protein n=1 Tax=Tetrahymena thermophila (strain SB210) TaxID=312017 RepID=Q23V95_TETTS|nr:von willebrand factor type A domain protein [Tetrahymena thermophila SB210]EAS00449.2 von willebrand factor type A domain protein [Tetrahymena thermophila SB210]|eukprot:XP_001020694.2 von willebrand factor type A domain protein [Tetrahymena thermophila SB210]